MYTRSLWNFADIQVLQKYLKYHEVHKKHHKVLLQFQVFLDLLCYRCHSEPVDIMHGVMFDIELFHQNPEKKFVLNTIFKINKV